ncbi:MAG: hypothetical protein IJO32_01080 [Bacilli bacterium]|nr:hypothetical protein [Bacilli bacterium]
MDLIKYDFERKVINDLKKYDMKYNLKELKKIYCEFIKIINNSKNHSNIVRFHKRITYTYSNMKYDNFYNFYSKKINRLQFEKNNKTIQKFKNKYIKTCDLLFDYFQKFSRNNSDNKYLLYLKQNYKISKDEYYIKFYNNFKVDVFVENKKIMVSFSNIYDLMDLINSHSNKEYIYHKFTKKINEYEKRFKKHIVSIINNNLCIENYFSNILTENNINYNCLCNIKTIIKRSEILNMYVSYKKKILKNDNLFQIELFSYNYYYNINFKLENILEVFSLFGENYISNIKNKLQNSIIIDNTLNNKGLTISNLSGNGFILIKNLNTIENIFVTVHELGHLMYNYYIDNKFMTSKEILISEISAILNEILLNDYLVKNNLSNNIYFLDSVMKILVNGIIEFEFLEDIYLYHNNDYSYIKEKYYEITKNLYNEEVHINKDNIDFIIDNNIYNDIYPLRYIVALIISINIFKNIQEDSNYINKYFKFIKQSSSVNSIDEALKILNINLKQKKVYENMISYLYNIINHCIISEKNTM